MGARSHQYYEKDEEEEWRCFAEITNLRIFGIMEQETRWLTRYNEVKSFILKNKRNPSKHRIDDHDMLNWVKANRKALNAGLLKGRMDNRKKKFIDSETLR